MSWLTNPFSYDGQLQQQPQTTNQRSPTYQVNTHQTYPMNQHQTTLNPYPTSMYNNFSHPNTINKYPLNPFSSNHMYPSYDNNMIHNTHNTQSFYTQPYYPSSVVNGQSMNNIFNVNNSYNNNIINILHGKNVWNSNNNYNRRNIYRNIENIQNQNILNHQSPIKAIPSLKSSDFIGIDLPPLPSSFNQPIIQRNETASHYRRPPNFMNYQMSHAMQNKKKHKHKRHRHKHKRHRLKQKPVAQKSQELKKMLIIIFFYLFCLIFNFFQKRN